MRIFFSAGEPSGDQHAAHLIQELNQQHPGFEAEGFGGPHMRDEGCQLHFELTTMAVMGFLRIVPMLAKFRKLVIQAEAHFDKNPPDAVVLVNFPGFNWWIAKAAKKQGIPVYFYMPPQLWGWAPWRISRVRKWVDHVICNLPFEFQWYKQRNVNATWVGHPFFDEVAERQLDQALVAELQQRDDKEHVITVLPGSRNHEVDKNFPVMLETIRQVSAAVPNIRWLVGNYRAEHSETCRKMQADLSVDADLTYFVDKTSEVIEAGDCCLMVSGSISLEILARRTPAVVLYRVPRSGRFVSRFLMTCDYITLTNLIAEREIMPEFISHGSPKKDIQGMVAQLTEWCLQPKTLDSRREEMDVLAQKVCITGATQRTAELLMSHLSPDQIRSNAANQAA